MMTKYLFTLVNDIYVFTLYIAYKKYKIQKAIRIPKSHRESKKLYGIQKPTRNLQVENK